MSDVHVHGDDDYVYLERHTQLRPGDRFLYADVSLDVSLDVLILSSSVVGDKVKCERYHAGDQFAGHVLVAWRPDDGYGGKLQ
jgi:hypothetical protein